MMLVALICSVALNIALLLFRPPRTRRPATTYALQGIELPLPTDPRWTHGKVPFVCLGTRRVQDVIRLGHVIINVFDGSLYVAGKQYYGLDVNKYIAAVVVAVEDQKLLA